MRRQSIGLLLLVLLTPSFRLRPLDAGSDSAVAVLGATSLANTETLLTFPAQDGALTVTGGTAIWKNIHPLTGDLFLAGNTLTLNYKRPLRFAGGGRFGSLGTLQSSDNTIKAVVYLDPTVEKPVGNNAPPVGVITERSLASFTISNSRDTSISWSPDGFLLAAAHCGDGSTSDLGKVKIQEFSAANFVGTPWTNSGEATTANKFGNGATNQLFKVVRFRPVPPAPTGTATYVVAVGASNSADGANLKVKRFTTSGSAGSKTVAWSANCTVASSSLAAADTIVLLEWNRKGDKLAVGYLCAADSKYKVIVFSADANGNLTSPTSTPLDINAWVGSGTLREHSIAWAKDDQFIIAAYHASAGEIRAYRVDASNNNVNRADLGAATTLNKAGAVAFHPTLSIFSVTIDIPGDLIGVKSYSYANDQITSIVAATLTGSGLTYNDLQWHPSGKIISVATTTTGTKSYAFDPATQTFGSEVTALAAETTTTSLRCIAWDPTKTFFARHDAAGTGVKAYAASAPKLTLTRIILVLGRDISLEDELIISDDCEIHGNGYKITMEPSAKITLASGKTLTLKNCTLKGVRGNPGLNNNLDNLVFGSSSSTLRLEKSVIIPTAPVRMLSGLITAVGEGSYIDQRFAPFDFVNQGQSFQKINETVGGTQAGDFTNNSQSVYNPVTGKTTEVMSGSTIPTGNAIDTGKLPNPIALPQATVSSSATNFAKTINWASWSIDGRHVASIHTGDGDAGNADPGILRIDAFDPDANTGNGGLTLQYDSRSDAAAMVATGEIDLRGTKGTAHFVAFRPKFEIKNGANEYIVALARNNPPTGTADIQFFRYVSTATTQAGRLLAVKPISGTQTPIGITLASGDVKAMAWDREGTLLAVITSEPKLRIYEYDNVARTITETSASGVACAYAHHAGQLFWGKDNKKLFSIGKATSGGTTDGVYQVFNVESRGTTITSLVSDTTTFSGDVTYRIALHPTEDILAVSQDVSSHASLKLYSYDAAGRVTDAQGSVMQKGTTKDTGVNAVLHMRWDPSGQGIFAVVTGGVVNAYEYKNGDFGFQFGGSTAANFGATTVVNKTLLEWGTGSLFIGGAGSSTNNDRAAVQKMAKKPAVSKTGGDTVLSTDRTAIIADHSVDSGTWVISGGDNSGAAPTKVLEITPQIIVTVKSGATLHLKNLILRGLMAAPANPVDGNINLCQNLKIEGGGTVKLENVVIEVFGDIRFDRSTGSGNATLAFAGTNPIKIIAPGGFGTFAIGDNKNGNRVSSTGATAGNMAVTFDSTTKVESGILKAPVSLVPTTNILAPAAASQFFAVQDVKTGAANAVGMFQQLRENMQGASNLGMSFSFERQAGATGIPKQEIPGGALPTAREAVMVGKDKVLGADGDGTMTFTGHTEIVLGAGDAAANADLTRQEALNRSKVEIAEDATVVYTGIGTLVVDNSSLILNRNSRIQFGNSTSDRITVDLRTADITLEGQGSRIAFGPGAHVLKSERGTINCKRGTIEFNATLDGLPVTTGTMSEITMIHTVITGQDGVALRMHPNVVTNGVEATTTVTLNSNQTSGMQLQYRSEPAVFTPTVSQDLIAQSLTMSGFVKALATAVNADNAGVPLLDITGVAMAQDSSTGKYYKQRETDIGNPSIVIKSGVPFIRTVDKRGLPVDINTVTGVAAPAA